MTRVSRTFSWALAALVLLAARPAAGQITVPTDNTAYGTTAAEFLLLGARARGLALSGDYRQVHFGQARPGHRPGVRCGFRHELPRNHGWAAHPGVLCHPKPGVDDVAHRHSA